VKIRNGFVSNSSSSSFVINMKGLSLSAKKEIISRVQKHNDTASEGHLEIKNNFVFGDIDQNDTSGLYEYVKINVPREDWES
jgi:hypothetical protein